AKNMLKGSSDPLLSSFHLGYNMLLNLMRVEGVDPETLIKRSFHQFQSDCALPDLEKLHESLQQQVNQIQIPNEDIIRDYWTIRTQLDKFRTAIRERVNLPIHSLPFLQPGRLAKVSDGTQDWGWGVV